MFTAVGRTSTKLFSPLGYLESPSAANDAVGWIFLFSTGRSGPIVLSDLLDTVEHAATLGAPVQAEAVTGLEQAEAQHTAARARLLAAFRTQQGHQADTRYGPAAWLRAFTRVTNSAATGAVTSPGGWPPIGPGPGEADTPGRHGYTTSPPPSERLRGQLHSCARRGHGDHGGAAPGRPVPSAR